MVKCYTLLLLSALLVSSMSAPAPGTGDEENSQDTKVRTTKNNTIAVKSTVTEDDANINAGESEDGTNSKVNANAEDGVISPPPEGQSHPDEIGKLIHKFSRIFDTMTLGDLKLLEKTIGDKKDLSEFEGLFGVLADDGKAKHDGSEDVYSMLDQLKDHYTLLHGILRGKISRKEKLSPVSNIPGTKAPSKDPSQITATSSSQNEVKPKLDASVEKIVEQQLMAAMKPLPIEDVKKLQNMLAEGNDPSQILKGLQPAFPKLSDNLIKVAVKYPSELKAVIEQVLFDYKLEGVTPVATTVEPSKPNQVEDNNNGLKKDEKEAEKTEGENTEGEKTEGEKTEGEKTEGEKTEGEKTEGEKTDGENGKTVDEADGTEEKTDIFGDVKGKGSDDLDNLTPYNEVDDNNNNQGDTNNENEDQHQGKEELSPEKTVIVNNEKGKKTKSQNEPKPQDKNGGWFGAWHFLIIFLVIAALVGVGYYCSHNRKKIRAGVGSYISDASSKGRRSRNYRYKPVSST